MQTKHPDLVTDVRGKGLMIGVEFATDEVAELTVAVMLTRGMCAAYTLNNPRVIRLEPPLIISEDEVRTAVEILDEALTDTSELLRRCADPGRPPAEARAAHGGTWSVGGDCRVARTVRRGEGRGGRPAAARAEDVAIAVKNAPVTAVTAGVNTVTGGDCGWDKHLAVVCEGGVISDRAGGAFTTGNTINVSTGFEDYFCSHPVFSKHEWHHSRQWAIFGPVGFPVLYGANYALSQAFTGGQCGNVFEWDAGFHAGGYDCNGFDDCG